MTPFSFKVITPEKVLFDGQTDNIIVRTTEGDVGILANHVPYTSILPAGPLKIRLENGEYRLAAISDGLIRVGNNDVKVLVTAAEWADEIDANRAEIAKKTAEELLKKTDPSNKEHDLAVLKLKRALNRLDLINRI